MKHTRSYTEEEEDLANDFASQLKHEGNNFSATNRREVKRVLERLAEKLVIKCMDEKAAALRESIGKVYEMADRGVESRYATFLDADESYHTHLNQQIQAKT